MWPSVLNWAILIKFFIQELMISFRTATFND
jgi:hypothetical protein